jgi:hypothetical protein
VVSPRHPPGDPLLPFLLLLLLLLQEWARLLAGPSVLRLAEACAALEDGARLAMSQRMGAAAIDTTLEACYAGLKGYESGYVTVRIRHSVIVRDQSFSVLVESNQRMQKAFGC